MKKRATVILSCLITGACVLFLFFQFNPFPPRIDPRPHEGIGEVMAREVLKLKEGDARIILIARDTTTFRNPASDLQLKSFFAGLKAAGATVARTNLIALDPVRVATVTPNEYFGILSKAGEGDVIASFLGAPVLSPEQLAKLGPKRPKVVAVCTGGPANQLNARRSFEEKFLQAAIVSRQEVAAKPSESSQAQEWFNYLFALATPANMAEMLPAAR